LNSERLAEAVIWVGMFLLISGPVHECAHAFSAWKLGDGTAKLFGRVSLDPIRHFDPIGGSLLIFSVLLGLLSNGATIGFGWAKPTPVNPYNLRGRYADTIVAAAGPLSNLALAAVCAIGFRLLWANDIVPSNTSAANMVQLVFYMGVWLNVVLMLFNLIPIPPLDGSHIFYYLLPPAWGAKYRELHRFGFILVLVLVSFLRPVLVWFLTPAFLLLNVIMNVIAPFAVGDGLRIFG
jgi:Zn-dependent protease